MSWDRFLWDEKDREHLQTVRAKNLKKFLEAEKKKREAA
jgi:hypothetical protein